MKRVCGRAGAAPEEEDDLIQALRYWTESPGSKLWQLVLGCFLGRDEINSVDITFLEVPAPFCNCDDDRSSNFSLVSLVINSGKDSMFVCCVSTVTSDLL